MNIEQAFRRWYTKDTHNQGYFDSGAAYEGVEAFLEDVHFRVHGDGHEFGIDYQTITAALVAMSTYALQFPKIRYSISCELT